MLSSSCLSTLGTGLVSWQSRLLPVGADALPAETVSTGGDDWVPQYLLTQSTPGLILGQIRPQLTAEA